MKRIPMTNAAEYDALTRSRRLYCYLQKAGATRGIKRNYRRRERRVAREETRNRDS